MPDYKVLYLKGQAEERQRQAERADQERERSRQTTFAELIQYCHDNFSRSLRAKLLPRSITERIPAPTGKCCPWKLLPWTECESRQHEIYRSSAPHLFSARRELEWFGRRLNSRAISTERDLERQQRFAVEDFVYDIIHELCSIPAAREEFRLGDGIRFENHANALDQVQANKSQTDQSLEFQHSFQPDQSCIHRVDGNRNTLFTAVEYKPPHKLSVENIRAGLRPMKFWEEVVRPDSAYDVMIYDGLEYSYLTNGFVLVFLWVPYDAPGTLYYHLCEPNIEVDQEDNPEFLLQPLTAIARVLCLCLMAFHSEHRNQGWRNTVEHELPKLKTSFDHTLSQIPISELRQTPPDSEYAVSERSISERTVSDLPSSPPSPRASNTSRMVTRSSCAPPKSKPHDDSPDPDANPAPRGKKRGSSEVTSSLSSLSAKDSARKAGSEQRTTQFCTQKCLRTLQRGGQLDDNCPNVMLHRQGSNINEHLINAATLIQQLKQQLDTDIDSNCTPLGGCGASGAPFKVTCAAYGYTMIGKGTTSRLWGEDSREIEVYNVLRRAQGSAVPVFLGAIDLAKSYFLHGAGVIRHMLIMAWAGELIHKLEHDRTIAREIARSEKEILSIGVLHQDLRSDNILWNAELGRALIIDFHCSVLNYEKTGEIT
ncbi:hypothetical protein BO94DRAFT_560537 [Aspergillus sclerotioniger CBS 115572]|uniref:Protein kinase domain-containing protein n=1 Tax=Aspergillus sclerotioniger CBS 115572 TaxID=1450535 RepID=A0A317V9X7_9EURO|nr:hypothetical protein BO94DRAFT_560537 [Aspergillus sclerotioniger CBS 115572]PWY70875.1 hypothetical protein BO94DRAFT_560537 [Aspergillus sclerotioniger CBS 115572]